MNQKTQGVTIGLVFVDVLLLIVFFFLRLSIKNTVYESDLQRLVYLIIVLIFLILLFCFLFGNMKKRFTLGAFTISFTVLIMGSYISNITNSDFWGKFVFQTVSYFSLENEANGLMYIFLSLFSVFLAYQQKLKFRIKLGNHSINTFKDKDTLDIEKVRYWTKVFMWIGAIATFIKTGSKIYFVMINGYLSTYLASNVFFNNPIIDLFDKFFVLGVFGYLATFPSYKNIKMPIALLMLYGCLSLGTGVRGEFVVYTLFVIWYLMKRDEIIISEKIIITRFKVFVLGVLGTVLIAILYNYGYYRRGLDSDSNSLITSVLSFINAQGGSGRIVALALENKNKMLEVMSPALMVFWPINRFLKNNAITRIFTGGVLGQSLEALRDSPTFSAVLTYITNPQAYLNGGGLGTCYIAELATSCGLVGVIAFNLILGKILKSLDNVDLGNWKKTVFLFNVFRIFIYIPRDSVLGIIPESVFLVLFIVLIGVLGRKTKGLRKL